MNPNNMVILQGNLGADPEEKTIQGEMLLKLRIATTSRWRSPTGELKETTDWHNVDVWGRQAERFRNVLRRGDGVYISGSLKYHTVEQPDGSKRRYTTIRAYRLEALRRPNARSEQSADSPPEGASHGGHTEQSRLPLASGDPAGTSGGVPVVGDLPF